MNCADAQALIDLYALDALPPDVADDVEAHIETCANCGPEFAAATRLVHLMDEAVPQIAPPPELRARIIAAAEADANSPRPILTVLPRWPATETHQGLLDRWLGWLRAPQFAAGAAVLPLLISAALAWQVISLNQQVGTMRTELASSYAHAQLAADVMARAMRGGAMVRIDGTDMAPRASGTLYYVPSESNMVLVAEGLPEQPTGVAYQLWLMSGDQRMNGGMLYYRAADGHCMAVASAPMPLSSVDAVGVTLEPSSGSVEPSGQRYLWTRLTRA
ncbi:MAG: hypothetical protein QOF51_4278 [Chloroflexota bacterium]|jgi:anti-sigma-K factor RskA|nr:hypothetical protein [Chloroflexota bacterium]